MESLAALSLACNVMQVIQFGLHSAHVCKQILEDKSPAANIEEDCKQLRILSGQIQASITSASGKGRVQQMSSSAITSSADQELLAIAKKLAPIAKDLETELDGCRPESTNSRRKRIWKGFKYQLNGKKKIDELHASLKGFENTMQSFILVDLREKVGKIDTVHFATLDQRTQAFSAQLASGVVKIGHLVQGLGTVQSLVVGEATETRLEIAIESQKIRDGVAAESQETQGQIATESRTTRDGVIAESQITREQVATESQKTRDGVAFESQKTGQRVLDRIEKAQNDKSEQEQRERLLSSLMFPEMNARYNAIVPSHKSTFEWIYAGGLDDNPTDDAVSEISIGTLQMHGYSNTFAKWLRSKEPFFWINGKPGSGKSALMKFLVEHPRTLDLLQQRDRSALLISNFIWNAGSAHQRRQTCVLSSILYQLLSKRHDVTRKLLGKEKNLHHKRQFSDWSRATIESTLFKAIQMSHCTVCVFLDGLDEIDHEDGDGLYDLLQLIHRLRALPNIKLCTSSRPEASIAKQLERFPGFRLQDLNEHDIKIYAWDTLTPVWQEASSLYQKEDGLSSLVSLILRKADGVFLWVRLVVSSIRNGLIKHDDWGMLLRRVDILPGKLGDLYNDMWQRLNEDTEVHRAKSALYLKLLLYKDSPYINALPNMLLASDLPLQRRLLEGGATVLENDFAKQCTIFQHQLLSRCAGFVELVVNSPSMDSTRLELRGLQFIHKSVVDFLVDTSDGHQILQHDQTTVAEIFVLAHTSSWIYRFLRPHTNYSVSTRTSDIYAAVQYYTLHSKKWDTVVAQVELPLLNLMRTTVERIPEFNICGFDFLSLASELGLYNYVKKCVQEESPREGLSFPDWKSTLLAHASMGFEGNNVGSNISGLELAMWLLQEGADPNFRISSVRLNGQTPFHCFLLSVQYRLYWSRNNLKRKKRLNEMLNVSMRAFQQFLDHGADTNIALLLQTVTSNIKYWRFPQYRESIRHESVGKRILRDDTRLNSSLEVHEFENMVVFVNVEMGSAMVYRALKDRLEDNAEDRKEAHQEHPKISLVRDNAVHFHVKLISRRSPSTFQYTTKVISSETDFQHWMVKPEQASKAYLDSENLEMDEKETFEWLVNHGYLSTALLRIPFQTSILFGHQSDSFSASLETSRFSIIDFTFKPAYSDLWQALSRLPKKDDNVSDFISDYNKYRK